MLSSFLKFLCLIFTYLSYAFVIQRYVGVRLRLAPRQISRFSRRRRLGSKLWSRRKVYWKQCKLSRTVYIELAIESLTKAKSCYQKNPRHVKIVNVYAGLDTVAKADVGKQEMDGSKVPIKNSEIDADAFRKSAKKFPSQQQYKFHALRMLSFFLIFVCFVFTYLSNAFVIQQYIGMGLRMAPRQTSGFSRRRRDIPEPVEDVEDHLWQYTDGQYSSNSKGDGPVSSDEFDPEKEKSRKLKVQRKKALRKYKRKLKQRDTQSRSNEYKERSKRRRVDGPLRRKEEFKQRSEKRKADPLLRKEELKQQSEKRKADPLRRKEKLKQ